MPNLSAPVLAEFATRLFTAAGVPEADASTVATSLVGANLRGHDSHGVMRIPQYVDFLRRGEYQTDVELKVESETPAVLVCDGQWGFGQVQAHRVLDRIIPKAKTLGLAAGSARHCGHIGRLGEYAERADGEGLILLATVNNNGAGQRVAPPGGVAGRLGTNPLCAGVPTDSGPMVLDFGTSVAAEGKVRVHYINGRAPVPEGWLIDDQGRPTTDPSVLYEPPLGCILPMGGTQSYKGFGLALVLDILAAGLAGGQMTHPDPPPPRGNNLLFILIDPDRFSGREALVRDASEAAAYVRSCPRAEGVEAILLPGDPERAMLQRRSAGGIPMPESHWARLTELAEALQVSIPEVAPT